MIRFRESPKTWWATTKSLRDFLQILGSLLTSFRFTVGASLPNSWFRGIIDVASLDIDSLSGVTEAFLLDYMLTIMFISLATAICCFCYFYRQKAPDAIREGHELQHWDVRRRNTKCAVIGLTLFFNFLTTVHITFINQAMLIITCEDTFRTGLYESTYGDKDDDDFPSEDDFNCGDSGRYNTFVNYSIAILIVFGLLSPIAMAVAVARNRPRGCPEFVDKRYDDHGNLVDYTDVMYAMDLDTEEQKACPYSFLYDTYRRSRAFYEIEMLMIKSFFVILSALFIQNSLALAIMNIAMLAGLLVLDHKYPPYLNPVVEKANFVGAATQTIVQALLLISVTVYGRRDRVSTVAYILLGGAIALAILVGFIAYFYAFLFTNPTARRAVKRLTGRLEFASYLYQSKGPYRMILPSWQPVEEATQRVWKSFWDHIIEDELGEDGTKRLRQLIRTAHAHGVHRLRAHLNGNKDPEVLNIRHQCCSIEGVDVYFYPDNPMPSSYFGKMYIVRYPFHAVMVYDDDGSYIIMHDIEQMTKLVTYNLQNADIVRKRVGREKLRGMSGRRITYHYDEWVSRTVEDGTEQYRDANGNIQTRTVYSTIQVHLFYTQGNFAIAGRYDNMWSYGFNPSLLLVDGTGSAVKPRTGQVAYFSNERTTLYASTLGIFRDMEPNSYAKLFTENAAYVEQWRQEWLATVAAYRAKLAKDHEEQNNLLSDEFWYAIYNVPTPQLESLEAAIRDTQRNPKILRLLDERNPELVELCADLIRVQEPVEAFWYTFWHDIWWNNTDVKVIVDNPELFNNLRRTSLANQQRLPQEELEQKLISAIGARPTKKLFHWRLLEMLYSEMDRHDPTKQTDLRQSITAFIGRLSGAQDKQEAMAARVE